MSSATRPGLAPPGRRAVVTAIAVAVSLAAPSVLFADERVVVTTPTLRLEFTSAVPGPTTWRACHDSCRTSVRYGGPDATPPLRLLVLTGGAEPAGEPAPAVVTVADTATTRVATITSEPTQGVRLARSFEVARRGHEVTVTLEVSGPGARTFMAGRRLALELRADRSWSPTIGAGWTALGDDVRRIGLRGDGHVARLDTTEQGTTSRPAPRWVGFRDRFWAMLARGDAHTTLELPPRSPSALRLLSETGALSVRYRIYSGPLAFDALGDADPDLRHLLFSGLWSWLRALGLGALVLFGALLAIVGHPGPAIVLLAATVKLVLMPVTTLAHRLQEQVDTTRVRLQPEIDAIKAAHRGEAQARRLMALYRERGVHPLYTLKSLVGVLIQLPVFIAVFDMLAENVALHDASFLGIVDLARPDALIPLPFGLPVVGRHLNLLPFLMTAVSLTATARFDARTLTPPLRGRQRRNLALVAGVFFLLFYAFPAGMVLYWTSTNALQVLAGEARRLWRRDRPATP